MGVLSLFLFMCQPCVSAYFTEKNVLLKDVADNRESVMTRSLHSTVALPVTHDTLLDFHVITFRFMRDSWLLWNQLTGNWANIRLWENCQFPAECLPMLAARIICPWQPARNHVLFINKKRIVHYTLIFLRCHLYECIKILKGCRFSKAMLKRLILWV